MTSFLQQLDTYNAARELVAHKLRLSLVGSLTGISTSQLRELWHVTHHCRPSTGKLPESVLSFHKSSTSPHLSAFAAWQKALMGDKSALSSTNLLTCWNSFLKSFPEPTIDINAAFYVWRDLNSGFVEYVQCGHCDGAYIYEASDARRCPYCQSFPKKQK